LRAGIGQALFGIGAQLLDLRLQLFELQHHLFLLHLLGLRVWPLDQPLNRNAGCLIGAP
jgi:hypothetical protein